jgi:hypothetical protein
MSALDAERRERRLPRIFGAERNGGSSIEQEKYAHQELS